MPATAGEAGGSSRAPTSPPLAAAPKSEDAQREEAGASDSPPAELDPLVTNGLASPMCRGAPGGSQLSAASRRNCETSGFVAAAAPTSDYGIDVHIDTGVLGLSTGGLLSTVQELFVTPVWTALVWILHALVVMLEWCFTIDLLDTASTGFGAARALRQVQATFTEPWLATVLAVGAVLAAYNGLIRRRVAETVGQAALTLAMMAAGLWVIVNPVGTVGALGSWANQASLGTLAVTVTGAPARGGDALAESMGAVFVAAVEVPWCYLEFGDVGWCRSPARLDPRLHAAAQRIAAGELVFARCEQGTAKFGFCSARGSPQTQALEHSASLLRSARSNGAIFLALPANGAQRNSIGDRESLLWAICQSESATSCRGATSAQAEFRTNRGTWPRVAGLLLIVAGLLGLLLLLGFLALRLLAAALISLLYLMLAPAAVLAPALGDGGRAVFRRWSRQLLGAVVAKLLFSFLLGAILAVLGVLEQLEALGWWTQWLLMSAFWWGAFAHRHHALEVADGTLGRTREHERRTFVRRASDAFEAPRKVIGGVRAAKERRERRRASRELEASTHRPALAPGSPAARRAAPAAQRHGERAPGAHAGAHAGEQARRTLRADYRDAHARTHAASQTERRLAAMRAQLARVNEQRDLAFAAGDSRRAARMDHRAVRIEGEVEREHAGLIAARRSVAEGQSGRGEVFGGEQTRDRDRFLDAQAALAPSAEMLERGTGSRRDYAALAGLAGCTPREYAELDARDKRAARLEIDRELASRTVGRRDWAGASAGAKGGMGRELGRPPTHGTGGRPRERPHVAPGSPVQASPAQSSAVQISRDAPARRHERSTASESSVMADAREVAARRKRQLGRGRP